MYIDSVWGYFGFRCTEGPKPQARYSGELIILGLITATGGGVLRDVLVGETPFILKNVYATLVIAGAILYYMLLDTV